MTPPEEHALSLNGSEALTGDRAGQLSARHVYLQLPVLTDLLVLLILVGVTRIGFGRVDFLAGSFVLGLALVRASATEGADRLHLAALDEAAGTLRAVAMCFAVVAFATVLFPVLGDIRDSHALLTVAVLGGPALILGRSFHYAAVRESARRGRRARTVILGAGHVAQEIVRVLDDETSYGLEIVGAVDDDARYKGSELGTRVLGGIGSLAEIMESHRAGTLIVAFSGAPDEATMGAVRRALAMDIDVWVVPRFFEMGAPVTGFDHIGSVPLVRVHSRTARRRGWRLKRVFDLAVASFGLLVAAPVMGIIALAVKLESPGPVLFKQERVGSGGRRFSIYKFRSMKTEPDTQAGWTAKSDRITTVGRLLRDSGLDELPQLFNVLKGDLTLVGPRPERPEYAEHFAARFPHYDARHRVPTGITGWAQIHGLRGDTSIDERARFDNYYIENWSLSRDVKILLLTWRTSMRRYKGQTEATDESEQVS